jgi:hypothetical protein
MVWGWPISSSPVSVQAAPSSIVDDPRAVRAGEVVAKLHAELIRYWKDKRRGRDRDGQARYEQACHRARSLGLNYVPAADGALNLTLDDILRHQRIRVAALVGISSRAGEMNSPPAWAATL